MNRIRKVMLVMLSLCLLPFTPVVYGEGNFLQSRGANGTAAVNPSITFTDVNNHWANEAIKDMAQRGIISGYEDESFKPENTITREEFAKLIAVTFSLDLKDQGAPEFIDVQKDRWSFPYIEATRDYLTGYYPPKGQAFFSPDTNATREDVAVALIKVLGYTSEDLPYTNNLASRFKDTGDISNGLRDYVALAVQNQLVSGYEDGTFRPQNPITRAEVATLLYKVIKAPAQDQADGPALEVNMPSSTSTGTFYVSGSAGKGAKVTVNGRKVELYAGTFKEGYILEEEGVYTVTVVAKSASGKTTTVRKEITYQVGSPDIELYNMPASSSKQSITIKGQVTDPSNRTPILYINGAKQYVDRDGQFSVQVKLEKGDNTFLLKAVNEAGKATQAVHVVTFVSYGPEIIVDQIPDPVTKANFMLTGTVTDINDYKPVVYMNDKKVSLGREGEFEERVTLKEGANTFTLKAQNAAGEISVVTKTIVFEVSGPKLTVDYLPERTKLGKVTLSGKITDKNDYKPNLYLNDEKLYLYGGESFSQTVTLNKGENVFVLLGTNSYGKTTTVTKSVYQEE